MLSGAPGSDARVSERWFDRRAPPPRHGSDPGATQEKQPELLPCRPLVGVGQRFGVRPRVRVRPYASSVGVSCDRLVVNVNEAGHVSGQTGHAGGKPDGGQGLHEFQRGPVAQDVSTGFRTERHRTPISERPAITSRDHLPIPHRASSEEVSVEDDMRRWAGVDWASEAHAACVVNEDGAILEQFEVPHRALGLAKLVERFARAGVTRVAIERGDGPVVDALLEAGLDVVVVSSRAVKALRTRYGLAGNKDDRRDAFILADALRTDGQRWPSLRPDMPETVALRASVRARRDLVATRVATANQLRAHLDRVFPAATSLFADLDSPIALSFLERFPTAERAAWLTEGRLERWLEATGYSGRTSSASLVQRLTDAPRGLLGPAAAAQGAVTTSLVSVLRTLIQEIAKLSRHVSEQLAAHPDGFIFQSLPRAGMIRAATMLSEMGDCRARFPTAEALASLAGVVPSTRSSGKHHVVTFRWTCDKKLRFALVDFAQDTRRASPWADTLYRKHRAQGKTHPHASRIVTRAWTSVLWRCWQDRVAYDPGKHRGLQSVIAA